VYAIKDDAAFSLYACDIDPMNHIQKFIAADYKGTKAKATSNGGKAHTSWNSPHGNDDGGTVIDDNDWGV
jgi:hypothetical protein